MTDLLLKEVLMHDDMKHFSIRQQSLIINIFDDVITNTGGLSDDLSELLSAKLQSISAE